MTFLLDKAQKTCLQIAKQFGADYCASRVKEFEENDSCPEYVYKKWGS